LHVRDIRKLFWAQEEIGPDHMLYAKVGLMYTNTHTHDSILGKTFQPFADGEAIGVKKGSKFKSFFFSTAKNPKLSYV
jgi:hypothetical protein